MSEKVNKKYTMINKISKQTLHILFSNQRTKVKAINSKQTQMWEATNAEGWSSSN